jgi:hypothetical protein
MELLRTGIPSYGWYIFDGQVNITLTFSFLFSGRTLWIGLFSGERVLYAGRSDTFEPYVSNCRTSESLARRSVCQSPDWVCRWTRYTCPSRNWCSP